MKAISPYPEPYNFSSTRCYIIEIEVERSYKKIEHKLPRHIRNLKGIFVSVHLPKNPSSKTAGIISLNFNGQSLKCFHHPVIRVAHLHDWSNPIPLDEHIRPNTFIQGYFMGHNIRDIFFPFTVKIYLHYKPCL
jgi:hypothetical protein